MPVPAEPPDLPAAAPLGGPPAGSPGGSPNGQPAGRSVDAGTPPANGAAPPAEWTGPIGPTGPGRPTWLTGTVGSPAAAPGGVADAAELPGMAVLARLTEPDVPRRRPLPVRLVTGIPVVLALVWLAFVALNTLLSGRFSLWLVVSPVPPVAFVVVPVLLLALHAFPAPRRDLGVVVLVAAFALGLPAAGLNVAAVAQRDQPPVPAGALRIVAWNTEYWDDGDDRRQFTRYLVGMHADVYLLQEYLARDDTPIDDRARLARDFPGYTITVKHELVVLSRLPIAGIPPVDANSVLRVDVRTGGRILSLYDVHVPTPADFSLSPWSSRFYRAIRGVDADRKFLLHALEADVRGNPRPLLVAGDFNTTPAMGDLGTLAGLTEDAARASRQLYPRSWQAGRLQLWRLDWTRTAHGVDVHRYEFADPAGLSDHDAQLTTITLPAR